jgi:hypothetical protein
MSSKTAMWVFTRDLIGSCLGLNEYRARCLVSPGSPFGRLDDDVCDDDMREIGSRMRGAGVEVRDPTLNETVGFWFSQIP